MMNGKRKWILTVILALVLISCIAIAEADVKINKKYFPDANFRNFILSAGYDQNGNGSLSKEEINAVTTMYLYHKGIKSLKGIEQFTALTLLNIQHNPLTKLDVSKNLALENLNCAFNELIQLNLSKNKKLRILICNSNKLKNLDVTKNKELTELACYNNQLTALNVSKNTNLEDFDCSKNKLKKLDVSNNPKLRWLYCTDNQLKTLTLGKNTLLLQFHCQYNKLKKLNVSKCTLIVDLIKKGVKNVGSDYTSYSYTAGGSAYFTYDNSVKIKK